MMSISCKNTTVCALLYMISIVSARYLIVTQQDFNFEAELVNNNGKKTEFTDLEPAGPETYTSGWKDNNPLWVYGGCADLPRKSENTFVTTILYFGGEVNPANPDHLDKIQIHSGLGCNDKNYLDVYIDKEPPPGRGTGILYEFDGRKDTENILNMESHFEDHPSMFDGDAIASSQDILSGMGLSPELASLHLGLDERHDDDYKTKSAVKEHDTIYMKSDRITPKSIDLVKLGKLIDGKASIRFVPSSTESRQHHPTAFDLTNASGQGY